MIKAIEPRTTTGDAWMRNVSVNTIASYERNGADLDEHNRTSKFVYQRLSREDSI